MRNQLFPLQSGVLTTKNNQAFQCSQREKELLQKISNVMSNQSGLFLLGGNRGVGKTSLIHQAISKSIKNQSTITCNISIPLHTDNLCYRILLDLSQNNILKETKKLYSDCIDLLRDYEADLAIEASRVYSYENDMVINSSVGCENTVNGNISIGANTSFGGAKITSSGSKKENKTKSQEHKEQQRSEFKQIRQQKYLSEKLTYNFIEFIHTLSRQHKIIVLIDEADKLSTEALVQMIHQNKLLILEGSLCIFLLCGNQQYAEISEYPPTYFAQLYCMPELPLEEFLPLVKTMDLYDNLKSALEAYYLTNGNRRELVNLQICDKQNVDLEKLIFFLTCYHTDVFQNSPLHYRSIISQYLILIIDTLKLVGTVSANDLIRLKEEFCKNHCINSLPTKLLLERVNNMMISEVTISRSFLDSLSLLVQPLSRINKQTLDSNLCQVFVNLANALPTYQFNDETLSYAKIKKEEIPFRKRYHSIINNFSAEAAKSENLNCNFEKLIWEQALMLIQNVRTNHRFYNTPKGIDDIKIKDGCCSSGDYVANAETWIDNHKDEIVGIFLFHPKYQDTDKLWVLNNAIVVFDNGVRQAAVTYFGYPGLASHKARKYDAFLNFLKTTGVFYFSTDEIINPETIFDSEENLKTELERRIWEMVVLIYEKRKFKTST